jgi:hypothetical protein
MCGLWPPDSYISRIELVLGRKGSHRQAIAISSVKTPQG